VGPPELVDQAQLELAIQAYVQATERLAFYNTLFVEYRNNDVSPSTLSFDETFLQTKSKSASPTYLKVRANAQTVNTGTSLAPDVVNKVTPHDSNTTAENSDKLTRVLYYQQPWKDAADDFIRTGAATAFILCQDYIAGLADRTDYLEYLRKQYGFAGTLANTAFVLWNASSTARSLLAATNSFVNSSFDNYEEYKYFKPTDEAVLDVAKQAQSRLRDYYLTRSPADKSNPPQNIAEALAAMHNIEHQCTHAGIKALIDKTVQGATLEVRPGTGTVSVALPR
jgi:hypothetical protein